MKIAKPFLLPVVLCFFTINTFAQSASGKLLLSKGQKIQIDNSVKSIINQEMAGQAIQITTDANMVHQVEVKDKNNNSYLVSSTFTKLTTNGNAMGQEIKFDSDKKEDLDTDIGKALKGQLNVSKELELDENAKVISGVKKDTMAATEGPMANMINSFTGGNGDESNGASAAFEVIPTGKKVGDSWSDSLLTEDIKTYRNYTIKAVNGNNATITITGKQITKKKLEQQGMEINVSMEGTLSGEGIVDMSSGLVKERTVLLDATSNTEVMGQSIPGTIKVTTVTTVKTI